MKLRRSPLKRGRVEIIPMIDTILILLIFYMSFSSFKATENRLDVSLPRPIRADAQVLPDPEYVLRVQDRDHIRVLPGGSEFSATSLRDVMVAIRSVTHKVLITIEAEPETQYDAVVAALDACAHADIQDVGFRPLPEEREFAVP